MLSTQGVQSEAQGKNTNKRGHIMTYLNNTIAIFLDIGEKAAALASSDAYNRPQVYDRHILPFSLCEASFHRCAR
jgi:hypothetical protein